MNKHTAMTEPPDGAIAGESVAVDDDSSDMEDRALQLLAGKLALREPFEDLSHEERREIAKSKLEDL